MRIPLIAVVGAVIIVAGGGVALARLGRHDSAHAGSPDLRAPVGARVRVQVLNGTKQHGLAQRATALLRDRGFDVVEIGTVGEARDTTLVLDLSGHPDWANRVARSFEPARIEARPDSSRYLDVAVILGSAWRPPAEPLDP